VRPGNSLRHFFHVLASPDVTVCREKTAISSG
jgi:hypothetical protein